MVVDDGEGLAEDELPHLHQEVVWEAEFHLARLLEARERLLRERDRYGLSWLVAYFPVL